MSLFIWFLSFLVSACTVVLHAFALSHAKRFLTEKYHRTTYLKLTHYAVYALCLHWLEIIMFAALFYLLVHDTSIGYVKGASTFADYLYFSASNYTSLGYGDLVPTNHLRLIAGTEALTGLILISWSAVFAMKVSKHDML